MMGIVRGAVTLLLLVAFLAMIVWTLSSRNRPRFEAAARAPLEDDRLPRAEKEPLQ